MNTYLRCFENFCGICPTASGSPYWDQSCLVKWQQNSPAVSIVLPSDLFSSPSEPSCSPYAALCASLPKIESLVAVAIGFLVAAYGIMICLKIVRKLTDAY